MNACITIASQQKRKRQDNGGSDSDSSAPPAPQPDIEGDDNAHSDSSSDSSSDSASDSSREHDSDITFPAGSVKEFFEFGPHIASSLGRDIRHFRRNPGSDPVVMTGTCNGAGTSAYVAGVVFGTEGFEEEMAAECAGPARKFIFANYPPKHM
jgi:hypothetical protein